MGPRKHSKKYISSSLSHLNHPHFLREGGGREAERGRRNVPKNMKKKSLTSWGGGRWKGGGEEKEEEEEEEEDNWQLCIFCF